MMRKSLSTRARIRIFESAGGRCHICGQKIHAGERWDAEHVSPLALSGDNTEANLRPAHVTCHKAKTARDVGDIAKVLRVRAKHLGIRKPARGRPLLGTKRSGFKHRMDGSWERRT